MKRLELVLKEIGISRQLYFHGSVVGNDVRKLFRKEAMKKLSRVFNPVIIVNQFGMETAISSTKQKNKIYMLFNKLKLCYDFVTPANTLCEHEKDQLKIRCHSLGNWFPVNFPNDNLKFKFHILVYHAPEKAQSANTCGLESEQGNSVYTS